MLLWAGVLGAVVEVPPPHPHAAIARETAIKRRMIVLNAGSLPGREFLDGADYAESVRCDFGALGFRGSLAEHSSGLRTGRGAM